MDIFWHKRGLTYVPITYFTDKALKLLEASVYLPLACDVCVAAFCFA